jgi:hypothetical protein
VSGRRFVIYDADARTRVLVRERYGVDLGAAIDTPDTFHPVTGAPVGHQPKGSKLVCDLGDMEDPVRGFYRRAPDTKGKFMEHGPSMLRFECEWRETAEAFGDRRSFALQYFLADDTLEILDKTSAHARGGQFTKFITRQRLPRLPLEKGTDNVVPILGGGPGAANGFGTADARRAQQAGVRLPDPADVMAMAAQARGSYKYGSGPTVWFKPTSPITGQPVYRPTTSGAPGARLEPGGTLPGPATVGGFAVLTSLANSPDFVTAADLVCGGVISVYGRPLLIKSCDPFTVAFGIHRLGIDQRTCFVADPATVASERAAVTPHLMPRGVVPLAPHVGVAALGSEEETRVNAGKILPTYRAERDFDRFYQLQGKCLRFEARLDPETCDPDDARREFVVTFFLEDDTIAVVEVIRDRKGASAVRWLSRGKHRNFRAAPDAAIRQAVLGNKPGVELPLDAQAAYDRVYSAPGDKFGYGDGFGGQGYSGGIYGKADRVGAGGTGVPSRTDVGLRDSATHAVAAPPSHFTGADFEVGARIQLAHAPGQTFILGRPDGFTSEYLAARREQQVDDARDVYVPDTKLPVPNLLLEGAGTAGTFHQTAPTVVVALEGGEEERLPLHVHDACLTLAKLLAGVLASVQAVVRQTDKADRGAAPAEVVRAALARYGCVPPACDPETVDVALDHFVRGTGGDLNAEKQAQENARATKHASYRPRTPAGTIGGSNSNPGGSPLASSRSSTGNNAALDTLVASMDNPLHGPHFNDYFGSGFESVALVDYPRLFQIVKAVAVRQQVIQPRLDKIVSQLRMALLSSRTHLRRIFRELDTLGKGIITFSEFRRMLLRHHLDIGLNDAQIRTLMARFPPADAAAAAGIAEPCISWLGFVEVIVDANTLAPGEIDQFLDFVRGAHDNAPDGVGGTRVWPELYPHVNQVSSWAADMDVSRVGIKAGGGGGGGAAVAAATTARGRAAHGAAVAPPSLPARPSTSAGPATRAALPFPTSHPSASAVAAASGPSHTLPVGGAPELPISRPRTAPVGSADPRPPPEQAVLDVVRALSASPRGGPILDRMREVFGTRRLELFRALSLYDTGRKHVLNVQSFVSAIVSAGLKLSSVQTNELVREICRMAGGSTGLVPPAADVYVDYNNFIDTLYA